MPRPVCGRIFVCVARYFRAVKITIRILRSRMLCCNSFYMYVADRCASGRDKDGGSVHRVHAFLFIFIIQQKYLCGKF